MSEPKKKELPGCLGFLFSPPTDTTDDVEFPYEAKKYVLSQAERSFYGVLLDAIGEDYTILAKVRLADLFYVSKGTEKRQGHQNKINSKHVDFVLCESDGMKPLAAIELDDTSHNREDRIRRDEFLEAAFKSAGFPLLRFTVKKSYNVSEIRTIIKERLEGG